MCHTGAGPHLFTFFLTRHTEEAMGSIARATRETSFETAATEAIAPWRPPFVARLGMTLLALAVAALVVVVTLLLTPTVRADVLAALRAPATATAELRDALPLDAVIAALALLAAVLTYQVVRLTMLVVGWRRYLARLDADLDGKLATRAPLHALGYVPAVRGQLAQAPGNPQREPLANALLFYPRLVVAGGDGAGKTTALMHHAREIAHRATIGAILSGRQVVPVLVPLARYAFAEPAPDGLRLDFLASTLRRYGATMLAGQLPFLLRRGRVLLLFDGLDELAPGQAQDIVRELNVALRQRYRNARVILTCRSANLGDLVETLPLLKHLPQATLLPLTPGEVAGVVRRAAHAGQLGAYQSETLRERIEALGLGLLYQSPAALAMLVELLAAGHELPNSRAALLADYCDLLCERASITGVRRDRVLRALGYLAVAFQLTGMADISGAQAWNERAAVRALLADSSPAATKLGGNTRPTDLSEIELTEAIDLACMAGLLERGPQGTGLRFRHALLLYLAAARHLDKSDAGLGRVSPQLLRPEWTEIVILWGGLTADPTGLAERLVRLAKSSTGAAAAAQLVELSSGEPMALALALTVATLGVAPRILAGLEAPSETKRRSETSQQNMRELFDQVLRYGNDGQGTDGERRARLSAALRLCEEAAGGELTPSLARLVRAEGMQRLVRAQAVQVLGILASPASLAELTDLLLEPDPIVREALQRGFHLAGAEAAPPLLDLVAHSPVNGTAYRRALEALVAVDGPAVSYALARLSDPLPAMRAAAATVLGAMRVRQALDPLLAALDDPDPVVRLAATRALGRLGDIKAQASLLERLLSPVEDQRLAAIEALGILRGERAIKPLIKLLDDRQPRIRAAAAEALGHIGDIRAVAPLRRHLSDRDAWAQAAAATALRALGQRA